MIKFYVDKLLEFKKISIPELRISKSIEVHNLDNFEDGFLLIERFLNPERPDLPDIDLDLCQQRRGEVLSYLHQKYGAGHVAQIGIFSTLGARGRSVMSEKPWVRLSESLIWWQPICLISPVRGAGACSTLPEFKTIPILNLTG